MFGGQRCIIGVVFVAQSWRGSPENVGPNTLRRVRAVRVFPLSVAFKELGPGLGLGLGLGLGQGLGLGGNTCTARAWRRVLGSTFSGKNPQD